MTSLNGFALRGKYGFGDRIFIRLVHMREMAYDEEVKNWVFPFIKVNASARLEWIKLSKWLPKLCENGTFSINEEPEIAIYRVPLHATSGVLHKQMLHYLPKLQKQAWQWMFLYYARTASCIYYEISKSTSRKFGRLTSIVYLHATSSPFFFSLVPRHMWSYVI